MIFIYQAATEMQNSTIIGIIKKKVTQYSMMSPMTEEEAEEIAESKNKILVSKHVTTFF